VAEGFEERRDWNEREQPRKNWSRTSTENRPCLDCSLSLSSFSFPKKFLGFEVVHTYNTTKMRKYFLLTFQSVYFRTTGSLLNSDLIHSESDYYVSLKSSILGIM
jgi:hypothetical protein